MRKIFRKIHLWLSVPFGLIITLICFSGAMLVFESEVNELMRPELYFVKKVGTAPLPVDQLLEKVAATLPGQCFRVGCQHFFRSGTCLSGESFQTPPFFGVCRSVYGRDYRKKSAQWFLYVYVSDAPLVAG